MNTVCNILGETPVKTHPLPADLPGVKTPIFLPESSRAIGVEFEVEAVRGELFSATLGTFLTTVPDNSLRNNGIEFVSVPIQAKDVGKMAEAFLRIMRINEQNHSDRTSTHVHVNVGDFTVEQLLCLCLMYSVFERLLFKYVGQDRENSIFCVPWYASGYSSAKARDIITNMKARKATRWEKYTSLNLAPIADKQTVEFRHLYGVSSELQLVNWVNIILSLINKARTTPMVALQDILVDLNTTSNYVHFATEVFGEYLQFMATTPEELKASMFDGVVEAKLFIGQTPLSEKDFNFENPPPIKKKAAPTRPGARVGPQPPQEALAGIPRDVLIMDDVQDIAADPLPQDIRQAREHQANRLANEAALQAMIAQMRAAPHDPGQGEWNVNIHNWERLADLPMPADPFIVPPPAIRRR